MTAMIFAAAMVIVGNHAPARLVCTPAGAGQEFGCKEPPRWICSPSGAALKSTCYEWTCTTNWDDPAARACLVE